MLQAVWKYLSPPNDTIKSPQDMLRYQPTSTSLLKFLHDLSGANVDVTIPFRITCALSSEEENGKTIVYIEAILPEKDEVFPELPVMQKTDTVEGKHKLTRFLVSFEDYMKLMERQKQQLKYKKPDALEKAVICHIDKLHHKFFISNIPPKEHAELKISALGHGLFLNTEDKELRKLIEDQWNGNIRA